MIRWLFKHAEPVVLRGCEALSRHILDRKTFHTAGDPYLSRFFLVRKRKGDDDESSRWPFSVYLHYFHRGDEDESLHNHPWKLAVSLVLTNGYHEERWTGERIRTKTFRPGDINILRSTDFHRVDLIDPTRGAWTLFISGKRVQDWGFWDPQRRRPYIPQQQFIHERDAHARQHALKN